MIPISSFFDLLVGELEVNPNLRHYYKFLEDPSPAVYNFRKRYFCQRLEYIQKSIQSKDAEIFDCGCGYGTTAIFLVLNGHHVNGNTLEFYYDQIPSRIEYWSRFGDLSGLKIEHTDLFDYRPAKKFDYIIAQDTLHHLEPIGDALKILSDLLVPGGRLISIEENGDCLINRFKNYIRRGNKLVIEVYDERTKKTFLLGNENLRSLKQWKELFSKAGIETNQQTAEYIRVFTPFWYRLLSLSSIEKKEYAYWRKYPVLKKYFYFGVNFTGTRQ